MKQEEPVDDAYPAESAREQLQKQYWHDSEESHTRRRHQERSDGEVGGYQEADEADPADQPELLRCTAGALGGHDGGVGCGGAPAAEGHVGTDVGHSRTPNPCVFFGNHLP